MFHLEKGESIEGENHSPPQNQPRHVVTPDLTLLINNNIKKKKHTHLSNLSKKQSAHTIDISFVAFLSVLAPSWRLPNDAYKCAKVQLRFSVTGV